MRKFLKVRFLLTFMLGVLFLINTNVFAEKVVKAPSAPTNLTITNIDATSVTLRWDKPKDNANIKKYKIYKNSTYINSTTSNTMSFTIDKLKPDTEYKIYIRSEDGKSNVSKASDFILAKTLASSNMSTKIIGYYPAWKAYSGYTPDKLDVSKLTHINYAFAYIGQDNKIKLGYPDIDPANFSKLNKLKEQNKNLKILVSVGGWSWSGQFSNTAASAVARTEFAKSCVDLLTKYNLDGIDLDWEYPVGGGLATNSKRAEDKQNFTLLLKEIRLKLDEQELKDKKEYLLTIAGGASYSYLKNIEPAKIKDYVDFVNIMTYDMHGPWDGYSDYNSPLYNNTLSSPQYKISIDTSVNAWVESGFPKDKLVVGMPFYGYLYKVKTTNNNGLYQKFSEGKAVSYSSIKSNYLNNKKYDTYFDSESMVPWLYGDNTFISFENDKSMKLKAEYVKNEGLAGAMIWELSQDYNNELLNAIYEVLK